MTGAEGVHETRWTFTAAPERDAWLGRVFPDRRGTDAPGYYEVDGGLLVVFMETVRLLVPCGMPAEACEARRAVGW